MLPNIYYYCIVLLRKPENDKGMIPLNHAWAEMIAEATQLFYQARRGLFAVKPKSVHPLVLRFLIDSEVIKHIGHLGMIRDGLLNPMLELDVAELFPKMDGRKHIYCINPEKLDEVSRWAQMNAEPLTIRFRSDKGLRIEPVDWDSWPSADWPWYPE